MLYKTKISAQLRTSSSGKGGMTGVGDIIELSGKTVYWEDRGGIWHEISSSNYLGKYIEMKNLEEYIPPDGGGGTEPPPDGVTVVATIQTFSDGKVKVNGVPFPL